MHSRRRFRARTAGHRAILRAALLLIVIACAGSDAGATNYFWGTPLPVGDPVHSIAMISEQTGVAVGERGTVLRTTDAGTTWNDLTDFQALAADLFCVRMLPGGNLLAVGSSPGIFLSTDAGGSWQPVANPSTAPLVQLASAGGAVYSAVGQNGQVLRSTDGGATWSMQPSPGNTRLVNQFWLDALNGYVLGAMLVRHTTDGGQTWHTVPNVVENFFLPGVVRFLDAQNGWIMVDFATWRTTNAGVSWFQKNPPLGQGPGYQDAAVFVDANTRSVCTGGEGAEIWRTTDDGLHWQEQFQQDSESGYADLVRLQGGRLLAVSTGGDLLHSDDNGATWIDFTVSQTGAQRQRLSAVLSLPDGRCFTGGANSAWMASTDFGHTWTVPPATPALDISYSIAIRENLVLVAGYAGNGRSQMSRTTDGGATWNPVSLSPNYTGDGVSLSMPSDQVAFVATYGGSGIDNVYRSTDAGASWQLSATGLPSHVRFNSIFFLDPSTGYLGVGEVGDASVWKTANGGGNWTELGLTGLGNSGIQDMHWFDTSRAVVGTTGGLRLTTDGGNTWAAVCPGAFSHLAFGDNQHGYAEGLNQDYFETTDGGFTWNDVPFPCSPLYYQIASTPNGFLVVGDGSAIFGAEQQSSGVPPTPGGPPFAGSGSDTMFPLRATPNPATGRVDLHFRSPSAGAARAEIFDPRGRKIASWSASVSQGETVLSWSRARGPGLEGEPAGVYLARVTAPDGRSGTCRIVALPGR